MVQWASFFWCYYSSIGINNKGSYKPNSNQTSKLIQDLYAYTLIVSLGDMDLNSRRLTALLTEKQKDIEMDDLYIMIFAFERLSYVQAYWDRYPFLHTTMCIVANS